MRSSAARTLLRAARGAVNAATEQRSGGVAALRLARGAATAAAGSATAGGGGAPRLGPASAMLMVGAAAMLGFAPSALADADAGRAERSFIAIKPDGVHRGLVGDIIKRFEQKGYKLVAIKITVPSAALAGQHYAEHDGKPFFPKLVDFLSSGPVVAMVWEGRGVIKTGRQMIGATNPLASAPGTIRGDYGVETGRNIIHGSDSQESAQREIALWFKPEEVAAWEPHVCAWAYE